MRFSITQPAGPDTVFMPTAFDSQIGKRVPFKVEDARAGEGTLIAAVVSPDGSSAELTFEVETTVSVPDLGDLMAGRGMSFGFRDAP